eukprot:357116-Chlamydomonas_euryale.AAC.1
MWVTVPTIPTVPYRTPYRTDGQRGGTHRTAQHCQPANPTCTFCRNLILSAWTEINRGYILDQRSQRISEVNIRGYIGDGSIDQSRTPRCISRAPGAVRS